MNSRMSKYHSDDEVMEKRVNKNRDNYKDIGNIDVDNLNLSNNVSVIKTTGEDLNISEIQDILKRKYVNKSEVSKPSNEEIDTTDIEVTKEYKLKDAIDKAYTQKEDDYEKNRYKKLRNAEYEILKSINVTDNETTPSSLDVSEGEMITSLLKTIDENALKKSAKSDELLSDLISDSNTDVLEPIKPDTQDLDITPPKPTLVEELEKTKQLSKKDIQEELKKEEIKPEIELQATNTNTFYTGNLAIEEADLEDFKDLEDEMKSNNILVKILIILLVLVVLVVIVYLLNKYLNLGLF